MRWVHKEIEGVIAPGATCPELAPEGLAAPVQRSQPIS